MRHSCLTLRWPCGHRQPAAASGSVPRNVFADMDRGLLATSILSRVIEEPRPGRRLPVKGLRRRVGYHLRAMHADGPASVRPTRKLKIGASGATDTRSARAASNRRCCMPVPLVLRLSDYDAPRSLHGDGGGVSRSPVAVNATESPISPSNVQRAGPALVTPQAHPACPVGRPAVPALHPRKAQPGAHAFQPPRVLP